MEINSIRYNLKPQELYFYRVGITYPVREDIINSPVYNGTYDPTKQAILYSIIRDKRPYTFQPWTMHIAV